MFRVSRLILPPLPPVLKLNMAVAILYKRAMRAIFRILPIVLLVASGLLVQSCSSSPAPPEISTNPPASKTTNATPIFKYKVVRTYPHDRNAFTQGLAFENGFLYEGTGLYGRSTLRKVELETGAILQLRELPPEFFGEGITIHNDRIIQLTWQSNVGFAYDKNDFELLRMFNYSTEGWGITSDGNRLIMSDGTATLHFLDPDTFNEIGSIQVYDNDTIVTRLNELEYAKGEIYANVWPTDRIAKISPGTGKVIGWIDLKGLLKPETDKPVDVLNGIAYDAQNDRLFVTGKYWHNVFEIALVAPE